MNIIGIRIIKGASVVIKNLKPGWYPFGRYDEPVDIESYHAPAWEIELGQVYQLYEKLPQLSVSSIVGKNGAGKSTIIDIVLRIINNFAFYLLDGKADDSDIYFIEKGRKLSYACGLYAKMYFETDGNLGVIECRNTELNYSYNTGTKQGIVRYDKKSLQKLKDKGSLLKDFFYTIECNYSQYGFRPSDYEPIRKSDSGSCLNDGVNGEWIEGLFHKNDGYLSPAVLTPFRDNGLIDYDQEERLANRRLITLSILYYAQNKQFVPGYNPSHLCYSFDQDFIIRQRNTLIKNTEIFNGRQIEFLIAHFEHAWEKILYDRLVNCQPDEARNAIMYLGYKSLKICLKYRNYQRRFGLATYIKAKKNSDFSFSRYTSDEVFIGRINSIVTAMYKDSSHITLKIHQCIGFLDKGYFSQSRRVSVSEYLGSLPRYTYDNVFKSLPPAYFNVELTMRHGPIPNKKGMSRNPVSSSLSDYNQEEFHFSQMSSGERQLMNSMSYVLYHIKNIQSIKKDADRVPYHHINLIFDEAELYFHPEYQRFLVHNIIDMLHWCHIDRRRIRSINIILATHSPYVLSDIFTEKSLYLKSGTCEIVETQSFGANYYTLLNKSFFFEKSPMGEIATKRIQEWAERKEREKSPFVGDIIIKKYLERQ